MLKRLPITKAFRGTACNSRLRRSSQIFRHSENLRNITHYSEGWALYAETLAREIGFYQDPYSEYGRL